MEKGQELYGKTNNIKPNWSCGTREAIYCLAGFSLVALVTFQVIYTLIDNEEIKSLMHVHVIFRHGDKLPHPPKCYIKDPYANEKYFPYGVGALTWNGRRVSHGIGENLRYRYSSFLEPIFYTNIVEAVSTALERCEMTLLLVLAGLFPPAPAFKIREEFPWQPIPYKLFPGELYPCLNKSSSTLVTYNETMLNLFSYVQENTGCNVTDLKSVIQIADVLKEYNNFGLGLPDWTRNIWPQVLTRAKKDYWMENLRYNRLPLIIGDLMSLIHNNTLSAVKKEYLRDRTKIFLYSMNQPHIISLLSAFGHYYGQDINYSSQFVIEVHKVNGTHGVKMYFKNGQLDNYLPLSFKNHSGFSPLEEFNDFILNDIISKRC